MEFEEHIQSLLDDSKVVSVRIIQSCFRKIKVFIRLYISFQVTYKNLSSLLHVNVNVSKRMLFTYYDKNRNSLDAMYFVSGKTKDGTHYKLVSEKNKPEFLKQFDEVLCEHIYALAKASENGITSAECYRADLALRQDNNFDISLRSIRNDNYSIRENRFQSGFDMSQLANNIEPKSSDTKPTQEAKKQQSDSKGKSKNSAISQMFAKTPAGTKKETKKEVEEKINTREEKPKESSKEKTVKNSAISQMFAKAPPKKIKTEEEKSCDGNIKDDSPGKENKNEASKSKDAKQSNSKKREKLQETQPNAKRRKRIQVS